ncbi:MAG TPA: ABC transporter permease [Ktedonobacterales bacterium]
MSYIFRGSSWDLTDQSSIPNLLAGHITITVLTLVISLLIAFPISLLIIRYTKLDLPVQTVAGILYTIPSFALIPIMFRFTGLTIWTLLIPLVIYAQVVLIRNIVAAIRAVDPMLVDVAHAMGMSSWQTQWRVVLPLSVPIIVAGIRVVAVTTIGIATIGPFVGQANLGTLILDGINLAQKEKIVAGSVLVTVFAVGVDLSLLGVQRWLGRGQEVATA